MSEWAWWGIKKTWLLHNQTYACCIAFKATFLKCLEKARESPKMERYDGQWKFPNKMIQNTQSCPPNGNFNRFYHIHPYSTLNFSITASKRGFFARFPGFGVILAQGDLRLQHREVALYLQIWGRLVQKQGRIGLWIFSVPVFFLNLNFQTISSSFVLLFATILQSPEIHKLDILWSYLTHACHPVRRFAAPPSLPMTLQGNEGLPWILRNS